MSGTPTVTLVCDRSHVEETAIAQLNATASLPGMMACFGMPDLHPGNKFPIGAAFLSDDEHLYPELVGSDIGCGMTLLQLDTSASKAKDKKLEKMAAALFENGFPGWRGGGYDGEAFPESQEKWVRAHDRHMGTIGSGNHFTELQSVESVPDPALARRHGIDTDRLFLLVHSGSRTFGEDVLKKYGKQKDAYLNYHDMACRWAVRNRRVIAERFLDITCLAEERQVLDICHNSVTRQDWPRPNASDSRPTWLHRKGAAPTDQGLVVIPGSRGTMTYLVEPVVDNAPNCGFSLAHGAGRLLSRTEAQKKMEKRYTVKEQKGLSTTSLDSYVVFDDKKVLLQEVPEAYKDIDDIIKDLVARQLIQVVAVLRPLVTVKL